MTAHRQHFFLFISALTTQLWDKALSVKASLSPIESSIGERLWERFYAVREVIFMLCIVKLHITKLVPYNLI